MLRALLGVAALVLQFILPAVHPAHSAPSTTTSGAAHEVVAHDALACPLCAAIAHGRASALDAAPESSAPAMSLDVVVSSVVRLFAAPTSSGAVPRGPPALA